MPRVIVKCRFYSTKKTVRDISGLLKYFATRPGVEKLGDGWLTEPVSKAQKDLIMRFTEMHKGCKKLEEYADYNTKKTKGAASEYISANHSCDLLLIFEFFCSSSKIGDHGYSAMYGCHIKSPFPKRRASKKGLFYHRMKRKRHKKAPHDNKTELSSVTCLHTVLGQSQLKLCSAYAI